jgi:replicative DNA helicase
MFYKEAHRRLFRALVALTEQRVVIDHHHAPRRAGDAATSWIRSAGSSIWPSWSTRSPRRPIWSTTPGSSAKSPSFARLIEASTGIIQQAYEGRLGANELLDQAEGRIFRISQERRTDGFVRIKEMLWPTMERIETLHRSGTAVTGCRAASQIWTR